MSVTPVLIHTDQAYRTQYTASCNEAKSRVQEIVDLYDAMGLDPLTTVEFPLLFTSIKDLLFDKITGGELTIGDVKVNKAKALEILEMPDGYDALVAAIATLKQDATKGIIASNSNEWISFTVERISDVFVLDVSNAVQFSTRQAGIVSEAGKRYATTDTAIKVYQFIEDTVAKYFELELNEAFSWDRNPIPLILSSNLLQVNADESFEVNHNNFNRQPFPLR